MRCENARFFSTSSAAICFLLAVSGSTKFSGTSTAPLRKLAALMSTFFNECMTLPPAITAVRVKSYVPGCVSMSAPASAYQIFGLSDLKNARSFPIHLPVTRSGTRSRSTVIKATDPCCSSFGCQNTFLIPWAGDCENIGEIAPARMTNVTILRKRLMGCVLGALSVRYQKMALRPHTVYPSRDSIALFFLWRGARLGTGFSLDPTPVSVASGLFGYTSVYMRKRWRRIPKNGQPERVRAMPGGERRN